jgi:hypothetical protein
MHIKLSNEKLMKSSGDAYMIGHFSLPAIKTCPQAGACKTGCYATQGRYRFSNVQQSYEANLALTKALEFVDTIKLELEVLSNRAKKRGLALVIRIHTSGDFYDRAYLESWLTLIDAFPSIRFYAYTKQVKLIKRYVLPANFTVIFSEGGLEDGLIQLNERHARVFPDASSLTEAGYDDASNDDTVAFLSNSGKIGLIYHGADRKAWRTDESSQALKVKA